MLLCNIKFTLIEVRKCRNSPLLFSFILSKIHRHRMCLVSDNCGKIQAGVRECPSDDLTGPGERAHFWVIGPKGILIKMN
jgi:hypothetical protein